MCISISAGEVDKGGIVVQVAGPLLSLIHTIVLCQAMLGHKCFAKQTNICLPPLSKKRQQSLYSKTVMLAIIWSKRLSPSFPA